MKYALINGDKSEALKGLKGICPNCGSELVAKCGDQKVNHWAHKGNRHCDKWWENETEWHRLWKDNFPKDWQEVVQIEDNTTRHIADLKTQEGYVVEFQHSPIRLQERNSRTTFYQNLIWVLDGTRRKRDKPAFKKIKEEYSFKSKWSHVTSVFGANDCKLIKEWHNCGAIVFLDFQDTDINNVPLIWYLFPQVVVGEAHLIPFTRGFFVKSLLKNNFKQLIEGYVSPVLSKIIQDKKDSDAMIEHNSRMQKERMRTILTGNFDVRNRQLRQFR